MTTLLSIAVTNAVVVLPLAFVVWLVGRAARRPALTHALWIVVLLKLVTPPMFHVSLPITLPEMVNSETRVVLPTVHQSSLNTDREVQIAISRETPSVANVTTPKSPALTSTDSNPASIQSFNLVHESNNERNGLTSIWQTVAAPFVWLLVLLGRAKSVWGASLVNVWIVGILVTFGIQAWLVTQFGRRVVSAGIRDASLQQQAERLARMMGLRCCPEVRVVDATISPMLWSCGARTRMLFPKTLMDRLDNESRETLIIHELAHFGRGDHWVRCLEFLTTSLFWWHPVVWWARKQIEESEEECCDAWVVGQIAHNPRRYAEALLDTIDFLCGERAGVPPMASGLGSASFLRRRLINIMHGSSPKSMTHRLRAVVAVLMLFLLPIQPLVFASINQSAVRTFASIADSKSGLLSTPSLPTEPPLLNPTVERSSDEEPHDLDPPAPSSDSSMTRAVTSPKPRAMRGEKVWSNAVSPDGRFVLQATTGRRILLNDLQSNSETDLSASGITAVSFTPDGKQFAAVGNDGRVTLWDAQTREIVKVLYTHQHTLRSASVSPEGDSVVVGGQDGTLLVLDLHTGQPTAQLPRQTMPVNCVRFSPDSSRIAVALGDWNSNDKGQVRLINLKSGVSESFVCETAPGAITFVSNDELIIGQWNGHATLWNLIQHRIVGAADADKNIIAAVAFSPDNPQLREIAFESP